MEFEWHADRPPEVVPIRMLDRDPTDELIDLVAVRAYRLARTRSEMQRYGIDACVLFDPVNVRYASGSRNMQIFTARNPARTCSSRSTAP